MSAHDAFIFQLRRLGTPIETSVGNVGAERDFYGEDEPLLEDKLASLESRHAALLKQLDELGACSPELQTEIGRFVRLSVLRSRFFRVVIADGTTDIVDVVAPVARSAFEDPARRARLFPQFKDAFATFWNGLPAQLDYVPHSESYNMAFARAWQSFLKSGIVHGDDTEYAAFVSSVRAKMISAGRSAMLESIERAVDALLVGEPQGDEQLKWALHRFPCPCLILGDCLAISKPPGAPWTSVLQQGDHDAIAMPISPQVVLVGAAGEPPSVMPDDLNQAMLRSSYDSIFMSQVFPGVVKESASIGEVVREYMREQNRRLASRILLEDYGLD